MTARREARRFQLGPEDAIVIIAGDLDGWPVWKESGRGGVREALMPNDAIPWLQLHCQLEAAERLSEVLDHAATVAVTMLHAVRALERLVSWRPWQRGSGA